MAAPLLRHDKLSTFVASTWTTVSAATPATRAFVISKITVANLGGSTVTASIRLATAGNDATIMKDVSIAGGQVYTETGLVAIAGEAVQAQTNTTNGVAVNVFGEEVDN